MATPPDPTLGEVYRLVERHDDTLNEIRSDVKGLVQTMGDQGAMLREHGARLTGHDVDLRDLKTRPARSEEAAADTIKIPITAKTVTVVLLALAGLVLAALGLRAAG